MQSLALLRLENPNLKFGLPLGGELAAAKIKNVTFTNSLPNILFQMLDLVSV